MIRWKSNEPQNLLSGCAKLSLRIYNNNVTFTPLWVDFVQIFFVKLLSFGHNEWITNFSYVRSCQSINQIEVLMKFLFRVSW